MCVHVSEASMEALAREGAQTEELLVPRGIVDIKGKGPTMCVLCGTSARRQHLCCNMPIMSAG